MMITPYGASSHLERRRGDETNPKVKLQARDFYFTNRDIIEYIVGLEYIVVLLRGMQNYYLMPLGLN